MLLCPASSRTVHPLTTYFSNSPILGAKLFEVLFFKPQIHDLWILCENENHSSLKRKDRKRLEKNYTRNILDLCEGRVAPRTVYKRRHSVDHSIFQVLYFYEILDCCKITTEQKNRAFEQVEKGGSVILVVQDVGIRVEQFTI